MILNFSNHPSSSWSAEQKKAAADLFGEGIADLPFPQIAPESDDYTVQGLADEYYQKIIEMLPQPTAVHLMGEMTFSFALIQRLLAAGICCVASTTARDALEEGGIKVSRFRFVRFRAYRTTL